MPLAWRYMAGPKCNSSKRWIEVSVRSTTTSQTNDDNDANLAVSRLCISSPLCNELVACSE